MKFFEDNSFSIGHTPLVQIKRVVDPQKVIVLAKIEGRNPAYSVKCRTAAAMVWDAEQRGVLKQGIEIIEPTSGNTGISLAFVGAARGYKVSLVMPETMSLERRKLMKALGARVILTPGPLGMAGAVRKAEEITRENPDHYFLPQQFKNPANPAIHEQTTGPEIWNDTDGTIDALVAGVGTGGTITGISRYIKKTRGKKIISIAVEPSASPLLSQTRAGKSLTPAPHQIQGIGANFIPDVLDINLIDRIVSISDDEAAEMARRLAKEEGILAGISSGAAVTAAASLAAEPQFHGKTIVVILPDSGERYLSTNLFEQ